MYSASMPQYRTNITFRAGSSIQQHVWLVNYVGSFGKFNVVGAKVKLETNWNIDLLSSLAQSSSDREVVTYLQYSWTLSHVGRKTVITTKNHGSALAYHQHVTNYIVKEFKLGCLIQPFVTPPWSQQVAVSSMSTVAKRNSSSRIIMDLSWPRDGTQVNDGISADFYMGCPIEITYPTVGVLCKRVVKLGSGCKGYKRDLDQAFKQIPGCPGLWPWMGIYWDNAYYFDKTTMMGS